MEPQTRVIYTGPAPVFEGSFAEYETSKMFYEHLTRAPLTVRSVYGDGQYAMVYRDGESMDMAVRVSNLTPVSE